MAPFAPGCRRSALAASRRCLLEGGAALHEAAWAEDVVDYVRLYVTPQSVGPGGLKFLNGRQFSTLAT